MKITKIAIFSAIIAMISQTLYGQSIADGLRMSQSYTGGTARFVSMGGAFGSIGADFSSIGVNPAGLGVYQSSEFTFTPSFSSTKIDSKYNGTSSNDTKNRLNVDNMGFVFAFNPHLDGSTTGINQINIGFGYTRTNDFNTNAIAIGNNSSNSIMDYFASYANDKGLNGNDMLFKYDENNNETYNPFRESNAPWDIIMAWNTFLIDTASGGNYVALLSEGDGVVQANETATTGYTGEYSFSTAINISDKFYIGAMIGITSHRFEQTICYKEDAYQSNPHMDNGNRFFYSDYIQRLETNATGYNFKIGAIYTPIKPLRIGLAIHTPTFFSVDYYYSYQMKSNVDVNYVENNFNVKTPNGQYDYHLESPFKCIGSVSYIVANKGLISVDVEHLNYSNIKFRDGGDGDNLSDMNREVSNSYKNITNIRVGAEFVNGPVAFRAGYAFYPSPFKSGFLNKDATTQLISGGIGYSNNGFFIDAAYQQLLHSEKYRLYEYGNIYTNDITAKQSTGKFMLTFGFRF